MTKLYKVLGRDGVAINGGDGKWHLPVDGKPGKWMPDIDGGIVACKNGYHLCGRKDILSWCSADDVIIYQAEGRGDKDTSGTDKIAFRSARLIKNVGSLNIRSLRLFAADCAEHVLHIFEKERPTDNRPRKAIEAARAFARGEIDAAAGAAARDAAGDAAGDAARDAARDAADRKSVV